MWFAENTQKTTYKKDDQNKQCCHTDLLSPGVLIHFISEGQSLCVVVCCRSQDLYEEEILELSFASVSVIFRNQNFARD